jgi:MtN3 and saliva related transmembrane protein
VTIELAAGSYGVAMALAPLLQLRRMRVIRSSRDVSLAYLAVLLAGFSLYLWYGISIGNRVLIVTNAVSIVATATTLSVGLALRRHDRPTVGS